MKAVLRDGQSPMPRIEDVPRPAPQPGHVLVRTCASLVSGGTERAVAEFAGLSLAAKAMRRPDLVHQVVEKVRRDGLWEAQAAIRSRLSVREALGYSCAGVVQHDGTGRYAVGALVACAGGGYANHAEYNLVPRNLVAAVPAGVPAEHAAFATVGAVALHAVRLTHCTLGETTVVIGLGLLGQLAVQLLKAAGCAVIGFDPSEARCALARELGCDFAGSDQAVFATEVSSRTRTRGADAVLLAAASKDSAPLDLATAVARGRARVVALGDTGLEVDRRGFYEKELELVVSRSYGPGRYDREYEEKGLDYPHEYVRWTEQRNVEGFLDLAPQLHLERLITHRFPIAEAAEAYKILLGERQEPYLAILLEYPDTPIDEIPQAPAPPVARACIAGEIGVSLIGAGNYARATLLPALAKVSGIRKHAVVSARGISAKDAQARFGFETCSSDVEDALAASSNLVLIATRHGEHARLVQLGLERGKAVFVEKPLCVSEEELATITAAYESRGPSAFLMVGYNRRFAPLAVELKRFLENVARPLVLTYRVNAGSLAKGSWLLDGAEGSGRIVGEACHFVDLMAHLAGELPRRVYATAPTRAGVHPNPETVVATIHLDGGSVASLVYSADGDTAHPKERLEILGGEAVAVLDDFRSLELVKNGRSRRVRPMRRDKGHHAELEAVVRAVREGTPAPIPYGEIAAGMRATFAIVESVRSGAPVSLP